MREQRRAQREWNRRHRPDGAHIRFGHDYALKADETVSGPIVVIGGSATIDGHTDDDVVVVGGDLQVGPTASVAGDVVAVGGHTHVDPSADVRGEVTDVAANWAAVPWPKLGWSDRWWQVVTISFTAVRLFATLFAAVLLTLIFPHFIGRVSDRIASAPAASVFAGVGAQILVVPVLIAVTIALVASVVGIPLVAMLPVLIILLAGMSVSGFTAVAVRVGAALRGEVPSSEPVVGDAFIGVLAVVALTVIGRLLTLGPSWMGPIAMLVHGIGLCVEYVAWTVGMGAALAAVLKRRRAATAMPTRFAATSL